MTATDRKGKLCRIVNTDSPEEAAMSFVIVEDNGNRLFISPVDWNGPLVPQELVADTDIEVLS